MSKFIAVLTSAKARLYLYSVATAALGILVFYKVIEPEAVPLWLGLIAALGAVGNGTAAVNTRRQIKTGIIE